METRLMDQLASEVTIWLKSVLGRMPPELHALYTEYGHVYSSEMTHSIYFDAFGFESIAGGNFDPSYPSQCGELGEFTWQPTDWCQFRNDHYPNADWMAVLRTAANSPDIRLIAVERNIQIVIGEHDGDVFIIQ